MSKIEPTNKIGNKLPEGIHVKVNDSNIGPDSNFQKILDTEVAKLS